MIPTELHVVCMLTGDDYPDVYVDRMQSMLARHVKSPFRLVCMTDRKRASGPEVRQFDIRGLELRRPDMRPTTSKLLLFDRDTLPFHEFLYLDVTTVIQRDMTPLLEFAFGRQEDLVVQKDWNYDAYNTCAMRIRHGDALQTVYDAFVAGKRFPYRVPGDQDFLTGCIRYSRLEDRVALFPEGMVGSYRNARYLHRKDPKAAYESLKDAIVVKFLGRDKPHQMMNPIHRNLWVRIGRLWHGPADAKFWMKELREHWR